MPRTSSPIVCRTPSRSACAHSRYSIFSYAAVLPYNEELLPEDAPREREAQICDNNKSGVLEPFRHREREKGANTGVNRESCMPHGFGERLVGERHMVINDLPVSIATVGNIGTKRNERAAWYQTSSRFAQGKIERFLIDEMFKEITGEDDVKALVGQWPTHLRIPCKKLNV